MNDFDSFIKFIESDNFENIVTTLAQIIFFYGELIPQIASGSVLDVASAGADGDVLTDSIGLVIDGIIVGGDIMKTVADTSSFVITNDGQEINLFDEFTKLSLESGMDGLKKKLDVMFNKFNKDTNFKKEVKKIINDILSFVEDGVTLISDILSIVVPDDAGVLKGIIGTIVNAFKIALLTAQTLPFSAFKMINDVYDKIPSEFSILVENPKYLVKFLNHVIDSMIFTVSKLKFIGEPSSDSLQKGGASVFNNVSSLSKKLNNTVYEDFTSINKNILLKMDSIKVPSLSQIEKQSRILISKGLNAEQILGSIVIPAPYKVKKTIIHSLLVLRTTTPIVAETTLKIFPLSMAFLYLIEFAIKN